MKKEERSNKLLIHPWKERMKKERTLLSAENNGGVTGDDTETQVSSFIP